MLLAIIAWPAKIFCYELIRLKLDLYVLMGPPFNSVKGIRKIKELARQFHRNKYKKKGNLQEWLLV